MSALKKIICTILYGLCILVVGVSIWLSNSFIKTYTQFSLQGDRLVDIVIFIFFPVTIFYLGNILIQKIDPIKDSKIINHFSRSFFLYLILVIASAFFISNLQKSGMHADCFDNVCYNLFMFWGFFIVMSLAGIIINALYLYRLKNKSKLV